MYLIDPLKQMILSLRGHIGMVYIGRARSHVTIQDYYMWKLISCFFEVSHQEYYISRYTEDYIKNKIFRKKMYL